jgi:hypothetical protein
MLVDRLTLAHGGERPGMTGTTDDLERRLAGDLAGLDELLDDDSFCTELYRALASAKWHRDGGSVALRWKRAEDLVNGVRDRRERAPLTLAQTGGEGEVSDRVAEALGARGWTARPLDTDRHSDAHVASPPDPPPPDAGARKVGADPHAWEREAHAEADAEQRRRGL